MFVTVICNTEKCLIIEVLIVIINNRLKIKRSTILSILYQNTKDRLSWFIYNTYTHTHTHTHMYICIYSWLMDNFVNPYYYNQFSSVQSLSRVRLFATPWIAARQASLSITDSRSWLKLMSIKSVMSSSHLILCCPLLLLPPMPPSIRVFYNESTRCMRWPKYWSFSFSISPSNEHPGHQGNYFNIIFSKISSVFIVEDQ